MSRHENNPRVKKVYPNLATQKADGRYYRIYRLTSDQLDQVANGVYKGHFILACHFTSEYVYVFARKEDDERT